MAFLLECHCSYVDRASQEGLAWFQLVSVQSVLTTCGAFPFYFPNDVLDFGIILLSCFYLVSLMDLVFKHGTHGSVDLDVCKALTNSPDYF